MKYLIPIFFIFLIGLLPCVVFAQDFSPAQQREIEEQANRLLQRYVVYGTLTENTQTISDDYVNTFLSLFSNKQVEVYNDGSMPDVEATYLQVGNYVQTMSTYYPEGVVISLEGKEFISSPYYILSTSDYGIDVKCTKYISGYTKEETIMSEAFPLVFSIRFSKSLKKFSIDNIRHLDDRLVIENPVLPTEIETPPEVIAPEVVAIPTPPEAAAIPTPEVVDVPTPEIPIETPPPAKQETEQPDLADLPATKKPTRVKVKAKQPKEKKKPTEKEPEKKMIRKERKEYRQMVGQLEGRGLFANLRVGIDLGNTQVDISNISNSYPGLQASTSISPTAQLGISYFFNNNWGIGGGITYRSYNTNLSYNSPYNFTILDSVDVDEDPFKNRALDTEVINEKYQFPILQAAISLQFKRPLNERIGVYAGAGLQFAKIPLKPRASITFDKLITKNEYHIFLTEDPHKVLTFDDDIIIHSLSPKNEAEADVLAQYDLYDYDFYNVESYDLRFLTQEIERPINLVIEGGFSLALTNRLQLRGGLSYIQGLKTLKKEGVINEEIIDVIQEGASKSVYSQYNSFLEQSNKITTRHLNLQVGLIFELDR